MTQHRWRRSSFSTGDSDCIELAHTLTPVHTLTLVRDSKNPTGPRLTVDVPRLLASVQAGRLDH